MAIDRKLIWDGVEIITADRENGREIISPLHYMDTATLPQVATVKATPSSEGWGGHPGITLFIEQTPQVILLRKREFYPEHQFGTDYFLNRTANIYSDGSYIPPELPQILDYVEQRWGWNVAPDIRQAMKRPRGNTPIPTSRTQ